jgi:hypothetical protein
MTVATHPGSSLETLSRRHDGELSAAEREAFERHLAGCAECREATAAFERSLAAFRTAPEAPVPSDLSARILRKIRSQTPSRRPFGVLFGIDIRWAGVFLAALLVAIVAPVLLERRDLSRPASTAAPLTAYVVDDEASKETRDAAEKQKELQGGAKGDARLAQAPEPKTRALAEGTAESTGQTKPADSLVGGRLDQPAAAPRPPASAPQPGEAGAAAAPRGPVAQKPQSEDARNVAPMAAPKRLAALATPDRSGGEGGFVSREEAQAGEVRIDVRPLDAEGAAPDVAQTPAAGRLAALRGREFVLVVGADGLVRSVSPAEPENERRKLLKDVPVASATEPAAEADKKAESASVDSDADSALRELRFQAPGKPRRVLVRIR